MTTTRDKAFLSTSILSLSRPVPSNPTSSLPAPLLAALNASFSRTLKLKYSSSAVRKTVDQLGELRRREVRARERAREGRRGREGVVSVSAGSGVGREWVDEMPRTWPGSAEDGEDEEECVAEDRERYAKLIQNIRSLRRQKTRAEQQLAHYRRIRSLASPLANPNTAELLKQHDRTDPSSAGRIALEEMKELLPSVVEELHERSREAIALQRRKKEPYRTAE